jgi:hypothetical protein
VSPTDHNRDSGDLRKLASDYIVLANAAVVDAKGQIETLRADLHKLELAFANLTGRLAVVSIVVSVVVSIVAAVIVKLITK